MGRAWLLAGVCVTACALGGPACAASLLEVYQMALEANPDLGAALAYAQSGEAGVQAAQGRLLPTLSLNASYSQNSTQETVSGASAQIDYTSQTTSLVLQQPLYRPAVMANLRQSQAQQRLANSQLEGQRQQLTLQVASAYLNVLLGRDRVRLAELVEDAYQRQFVQAERLLGAGEGTRTDVDDARARLASAQAQRLAAQGAARLAQASIRQLVGRDIETYDALGIDAVAIALPVPADAQAWGAEARANSPSVRAAMEGDAAATADIDRARDARWPTLDLIAAHNLSSSGSDVTIGQAYNTTYVGVQLALPIFDAGAGAQVDQAAARQRIARFQVESVQRKAEFETRQDYLTVDQSTLEIPAQRLAVGAAQTALESSRKGVQAGTRTLNDVLIAQQQLYVAQRDLLENQYRYLVAMLKLKADVGRLDETDLRTLAQLMRAATADSR